MKHRVTLLVLTWTLLMAPPVFADAPDESEPFDFWLSEAHVRRLAEEDTILARMRVSLNHRTKKVHTIDDDCEIHIAATSSTQLAVPAGSSGGSAAPAGGRRAGPASEYGILC